MEKVQGNIISLRKAEVNKMLTKWMKWATQAVLTMSEPFITRGETVKIIGRAFNDFNGVIEEVNDEKNWKTKVQVKIFGRATPVELELYAGRKIS